MLRTAAAKIAWVVRTASVVFGLALVMALSSCDGGSQETKNPVNSESKITFTKEESNGSSQTYVANADLSDQKKVTSGPADNGWSAVAPPPG